MKKIGLGLMVLVVIAQMGFGAGQEEQIIEIKDAAKRETVSIEAEPFYGNLPVKITVKGDIYEGITILFDKEISDTIIDECKKQCQSSRIC